MLAYASRIVILKSDWNRGQFSPLNGISPQDGIILYSFDLYVFDLG